VPDYAAVKAGTAARDALPRDAGALVLYGFAFGARAGDVVALRIEGPQGEVIDHTARIERARAQLFRAAGWPAGRYRGTVTLTRDGAEIARLETTVTLR
jgi:hypothetical protein